jgi:hypothetical protein
LQLIAQNPQDFEQLPGVEVIAARDGMKFTSAF